MLELRNKGIVMLSVKTSNMVCRREDLGLKMGIVKDIEIEVEIEIGVLIRRGGVMSSHRARWWWWGSKEWDVLC